MDADIKTISEETAADLYEQMNRMRIDLNNRLIYSDLVRRILAGKLEYDPKFLPI